MKLHARTFIAAIAFTLCGLAQNARADGFERPVFYGLGSYGVACRALIKGLCGGDAARCLWGDLG